MDFLRKTASIFILSVLCLVFLSKPAHAVEHIYVDQATGVNSSSTTGAENDPFKSITYAVLVADSRDLPAPWVVHVKAGTYDANPAKPANEREIFPIELGPGITIQGDDGAEDCIISGAFNASSNSALIRGQDISGFTIKDLTLTDMDRTGGTRNGAACEFINSSGTIQGCVVKDNSAG